MHNLELALQGAWRVLLAGLILGAGLPALFAVGVRVLAYSAGGNAEEHDPATPAPASHPWARPLAYLCFAVVAAAAAFGVFYVVASGFGLTLSFTHIYPTLVKR